MYLYRQLIVNNAEKIETVLSQMEQWSILSNVINYIQYDKHPKNYHSLNISTVNKETGRRNSYIKEEEGDMLELDFGDMPGKLKEEYLDVYEGIQSEILSTTRFDENPDFTTTYLGKVDKSKNNKIKQKNHFQYHNKGTLWENCWMEQNAKYYYIQEQANPCQNHIIYTVNHSISLHLKHKKFRKEMDNLLVFYS